MSAIAFSKFVGPVALDVIIKESHKTEIGITGEPIETGAEVNDHAYIKPKRLTLEIADNKATATYNALIALQESRFPFYMLTGLTIYKNMLIQTISVERDKDTYAILSGTIELQEVIIVDTAYATTSTTGSELPADGKPGGSNSLKAARPSKSLARDTLTADRVEGTVGRGDQRVVTAPTTGFTPEAVTNRSILARYF